MSTRKTHTMYVMSHTHWDREWYQAFQGYRRRLVFQMDAMMDLLESRPEFPCFHLDGQTSVLGDYLEIRPEGRARLAALIRSGRVLVGPWFTMPDECHLSGESIVRNLLLGHRHCREWEATPMPIGWVSDVFSHVSQLPQILAGFGLDSAFMHHGTPCTEDERAEMRWVGADGTEVLLLKAYPWYGYQDFLQMRYRTREEVQAYERKKIALGTTPVLFGMDGNDHEPAKWDTPEVIARMNTLMANTRVVHASLPQYLAALRRALGPRGQQKLKRFTGELRVPSKTGNWNGLTNGTGSSRLPLKQANDRVELLLARLAEPLNAWATLRGGERHAGYLDLAWKYLMLNHPHDSICGCSIDQAHRDMVYRFDQSRLLAEDSIDDSMQSVADDIDPAGLAGAEQMVTVFNAAAGDTGPVTTLSFELPTPLVAEKAKQGLQPVLLDEKGRAVPMQVLCVEKAVRARPLTYKDRGYTPAIWVKRDYAMDRFHVAAVAAVPALGYRTLGLAFVGRGGAKPVPAPRVREVKVDAARGLLENGRVSLRVRADGRVDLYDSTTRTWFRGLHAFEDVGDAGDGWNHQYPTVDTVVLSTAAKSLKGVRVRLGHQGPLSCSLRVSLRLRVPADLERGEAGRSARTRATVWLPIETEFTLLADSGRIDCRTTVQNKARCHRLRAIFPTNRATDVWYGDNAFDTVKRPVQLRDTRGWNERDREECPIKNFVAVCDRRAGLAILTKGLYEAAVQDQRARPIALTLFRGFVEHLFFESTCDSLLLGELQMEYALQPFAPEGGEPPAALHMEADRYKLPLPSYTRPASGEPVAVQALPPCSEASPPQPPPSAGTEVITPSPQLAALMKARPVARRDLPASGALLQVSAPLVISTIKTAEDGRGLVARVWNPTGRGVQAVVIPGFACRKATRTDLLERPQGALPVRGGAVRFKVGPKQIVTLRLER